MGRSGIRYEEVEEAAQRLQQAHINPTHERVRQALGGGSFSTIGRHLQTWRQACQIDGEAAAEAIPPDSLVDAVKGVWQGMRGAAEARVASVEAEAQQVVAQAHAAANARVEAAEAQARAAIGNAQQETAVEQRATARLMAEIEALKENLREQQALHQSAQRDCAAAQSRQQAMAAELERAGCRHAELTQELARQTSQWQGAIRDQNEQLSAKFAQALLAQCNAWRQECDALAARHQQLATRQARIWQTASEALRARLADVTRRARAQLAAAETRRRALLRAAKTRVARHHKGRRSCELALQRAQAEMTVLRVQERAAQKRATDAQEAQACAQHEALGRTHIMQELRQLLAAHRDAHLGHGEENG